MQIFQQQNIPLEIKRITKNFADNAKSRGEGLEITWSNGERCMLTSKILRENCPCAICQEKRGDTAHHTPLSGRKNPLRIVSATAEQETDLTSVHAVGNYAIKLVWGDGHNTGIYPFELLRGLVDIQPPLQKL